MSRKVRTRIDYMPGDAAQKAIDDASRLMPNLGTQALLDKLILTGVSAITHVHWTPPALYGKDRDKWTYLPQHQPKT